MTEREKQRDRLIELLTDAGKEVARIFKIESENCLKRGEIPQHSKTIQEIEADYLLANGVKVEIPNNSVSMVDGHIEERKKTRWSINPDGYYPQCTNCWEEPKSGQMGKICPNCGAEMEGF